MPLVDVVYQITVYESERGYGRKEWHQYYESDDEAKRAIKGINDQNTEPTAPDWYMAAYEEVKMVPRAEAEKDKYRG